MRVLMALATIFFIQQSFAVGGKHDFSQEIWSAGRSCLICHSLKNDLPKVAPPDSRVVDLKKLNSQEQAAYDSNPMNAICFVCHQEQHSYVAPKANSNTTTIGSSLPGPKVPPVFTSGTEGGVNIRVINYGSNSLDCLQCHDLHNDDSLKMLKVDYQ